MAFFGFGKMIKTDQNPVISDQRLTIERLLVKFIISNWRCKSEAVLKIIK